jgi:ABC-type Fe3+-siderophore transport system permease subunit
LATHSYNLLLAVVFAALAQATTPAPTGLLEFVTDNILAIVAGAGAVLVALVMYLLHRRRGGNDVFKL